MRILTTGFLILCLCATGVNAQSESELREFFDEGQYFFVRGDYEDALHYYLQLLDARPDNANFNFKAGECYLNIEGREHLAIPYFEKSCKRIVPKKEYNKRDYEESAAPLHALFYLGNAYRMDNQLDKALESYQKFIDSPYYYGNYNLNVVDQEIKACERAKIIQDAPLDLRITNLGEKINSEFTEERPVVSGDGNTLVFIRRLQFYDAIFFARKTNDEWSQAVNINPQLISDGQFYPTGLSNDGNTLLLVKNENQNTDIYISYFRDGMWSEAEILPGKVNTSAQESHASFGKDTNTLFLSSDRGGGKGGLDIYLVQKDNSGEWGKPKNLGKVINTSFDEQVACLSTDGDVLFFSSKGHYNMGSYDIFYSRKQGKDWFTPTNLGYPINTTRDNLYYQPLKSDRRVGFVSLQEEDGFGGKDICLVEILSPNILSFEE